MITLRRKGLQIGAGMAKETRESPLGCKEFKFTDSFSRECRERNSMRKTCSDLRHLDKEKGEAGCLSELLNCPQFLLCSVKKGAILFPLIWMLFF